MNQDLPKGYTCTECGKFHKFNTYVYAHYETRLSHICDNCNRPHWIVNGKATPRQSWLESLRECAVQADSLQNYLKRYYKPRRIHDFDSLLRSYQAELDKFGFVHTSHHDNVTGRHIAWFLPDEQTIAEEDSTR
jgi:hypothetical protein